MWETDIEKVTIMGSSRAILGGPRDEVSLASDLPKRVKERILFSTGPAAPPG